MARLSRIGFQRLREVALRHQHVADLAVGHREIALPARIAGVGLGQALPNGEAVAEGFQRLRRDCPAPTSTSPTLLVGDREIALPAGIAGVGLGQALAMARPSW